MSRDKQLPFKLGLPATYQNLAVVQGVLDKINARINILQDFDVREMSKEELKNYILSQLGQPKQSKANPDIKITIDALFLDFMEYMRLILQRSKATLATYLTVYNVVTKLDTRDISQSKKILRDLAKLEYPAYYRALQKLSVCCNWAVENEKIPKNLFLSALKGLREPKATDKYPDPFSRQAMERIIEAYRKHPRYHRYTDLVEFYFLTGIRTGEAVGLLWSDIDFEKGVIHIRKTIALVGGKPDSRDETKTKKDRDFPIEDPALEELLRRLWSSDKKPSDFVFQEPDGKHVSRTIFYYSWYGKKNKSTLKSGIQKEYPPTGIVYKLAALSEENGGIDHYRPQYNTRHTFISLVIEGMVKLDESTMRDITTLADYVGNSADVILEHYLGRSGKRGIVIVSRPPEESVASEIKEENLQTKAAQIHQINELEQRNSRLQITLESLVQFFHTTLLQFVPEALRSQLSAFVTTLGANLLPNSISNKDESPEILAEEMAKCAALLVPESNPDS